MTLSTPVPQAASKTVLTPLASSREVMNCLHHNKNKNMSSLFSKKWKASGVRNVSEPIRVNHRGKETWEMGG
jgi:hypothetical protein